MASSPLETMIMPMRQLHALNALDDEGCFMVDFPRAVSQHLEQGGEERRGEISI